MAIVIRIECFIAKIDLQRSESLTHCAGFGKPILLSTDYTDYTDVLIGHLIGHFNLCNLWIAYLDSRAPSLDPKVSRFDPEVLSFDRELLPFDPEVLSFDREILPFDPEVLSFDREILP